MFHLKINKYHILAETYRFYFSIGTCQVCVFKYNQVLRFFFTVAELRAILL